MKKFFKLISIIVLLLIAAATIYYFINNEALPIGKQGKSADSLALKMLDALNNKAFKTTEIITWSFRGTHFYKWHKQEDIVEVSWGKNKVILHTNTPKKSEVYIDNKKVNNLEILKDANSFFNNDSFWLVAPYKVFDTGTERRIVNYKGKEALLITYTSGGSTPGDSYLWILNEQYFPTAFKMWTKIIPMGGVSASWSHWKTTKTGIQLPTKHQLSLFGLEFTMGNPTTENKKATALANKMLQALKNKAYQETRFLEWSFAERRFFKWDKEKNIVEVSWDSTIVKLYTRNKNKSRVLFCEKKEEISDTLLVNKAWDIFNNDSFWLVAPHKIFDKGTRQSIVHLNNKDALLVQYTLGGSTPGDSYLWILDADYRPLSYQMYVPSMKMNGTLVTWEDWTIMESGTLLPLSHSFSNGNKLSMGNVKAYN